MEATPTTGIGFAAVGGLLLMVTGGVVLFDGVDRSPNGALALLGVMVMIVGNLPLLGAMMANERPVLRERIAGLVIAAAALAMILTFFPPSGPFAGRTFLAVLGFVFSLDGGVMLLLWEPSVAGRPRICLGCGYLILPGQLLCPSCGRSVVGRPAPAPPPILDTRELRESSPPAGEDDFRRSA